MKRINNLYNKICNLNNIHLAELRARKGKTKKNYVIEFNKRRTENLIKVYLELKNETYKPSKYTFFTIYEPKPRKLSKSPYHCRIVQHSILNILEPIFKDCLISQTYSSLKGRGLHKCLKELHIDLKDEVNTKYTLKLDFKKFYQSIDNEILIQLLERKFKDKKLLRLLKLIILSHDGLPLGSFTSQFFAHFYVNGLNHWLKEIKKVKYLRVYGDDYVILHNSKEYLHKLRREIQEYLKINLKLELSRFQVFPTNVRKIDFLGFVSKKNHIRLRPSIVKNMKKMLKKRKNHQSIQSYKGWTKPLTNKNLENKYLNYDNNKKE